MAPFLAFLRHTGCRRCCKKCHTNPEASATANGLFALAIARRSSLLSMFGLRRARRLATLACSATAAPHQAQHPSAAAVRSPHAHSESFHLLQSRHLAPQRLIRAQPAQCADTSV